MSKYDENPRIICKDLIELNSEFLAVLNVAIEIAREEGLDPVVIETYRSQTRQDYLYSIGRTRGKKGEIRTKTRNSKHSTRLAADVVPRRNGKIDWNWKDGFDQWGEIAKKHGLFWGGDFRSFYDGPHVQASWA